MTLWRRVEERLRALEEIRSILSSMKNLALLETRKLSRFIHCQTQVVREIEHAAADFLTHYPEVLPAAEERTRVYLIVGTERGFCGDFNQRLLQAVGGRAAQSTDPPSLFLPIGARLTALLEPDPGRVYPLAGPTATEEVPDVVTRLVDALSELDSRHGPLALTAVHHVSAQAEPHLASILPPFRDLGGGEAAGRYPPWLYLSPPELMAELVEHYLFAALYGILYTSLLAEHQRRVDHLEGAVQALDRRLTELGRTRNALRQEEITEEIEVILLSLEATQSG